MVLSKVGAAGSLAIRSISARFSAMAAPSAGLRSATLKRPKGGTPPHGPVHGSMSGLAGAAACGGAAGFGGSVAQPRVAMVAPRIPAVSRANDVIVYF